MPPTRKTPYVSVNLAVPARDDLQRVTLSQSAQLNTRFTLSAVLTAAIKVAENHSDELRAELTGEHKEGEDQ